MKKNLDTIVQKFTSVSRRVFLSFFVLFFLYGVITGVIMFLELKWTWLEVITKLFLLFIFLTLGISWIIPGLLIILGVPKLAHAWLRGISPFAISNKPWEQLSDNEKFPVYLSAIASFTFTLLAIAGLILQYIR